MGNHSKGCEQVSWLLGEHPCKARERQIIHRSSKFIDTFSFLTFDRWRDSDALVSLALLVHRRPRMVPGVVQKGVPLDALHQEVPKVREMEEGPLGIEEGQLR